MQILHDIHNNFKGALTHLTFIQIFNNRREESLKTNLIRKNWMPCHKGVSSPLKVDMIRLLFIMQQKRKMQNPLELLISFGVNINVKDDYEITPLQVNWFLICYFIINTTTNKSFYNINLSTKWFYNVHNKQFRLIVYL